jgi:hypothetical protein
MSTEHDEDEKTMQILGYAVAVTVLSHIGHANDVASKVLSEQLEQQPFPEVAIMVLFGLALLGVSAIIRWRMRT